MREKCLKVILEKQNLFLDEKNILDENIKIGAKLISDLRNLTLEVIYKWQDYLQWHKCMQKWAWKLQKKQHGILESEINGSQLTDKDTNFLFGLEDLKLEEFQLDWEEGNYFDKLVDDSQTLHNSKWSNFFNLEPMDIFLYKTSRKSLDSKKRSITMTFQAQKDTKFL